MRRRDSITLLGSTVVTRPLTARAQQAGGLRRIAVLTAYGESNAEARAWVRGGD
jgi:hypothetical protein